MNQPDGSQVSSSPSLVLAVDVGGTSIKAALLDRAGVKHGQTRTPTPAAEGPERVVRAIETLSADLVARAGAEVVIAAAVVVPGQVDSTAGIARYAANLGWRDVPLRDRLANRIGRPVVLSHDVGAAGVAESELGLTRGVDSAAIVVIGTGIAATFLSGGDKVVGAMGLAGELGHVPVFPEGEPCACGQIGCLETYASASAIVRRYHEQGGLAELGGSGAGGVAARLTIDPVADRVWTEAVTALAIGLTSVTMMFDPEIIVIGGGLSAAGATLLDPVRAALSARLTWRPPPRVELSPLGDSAGLLGAGVLAWRLADSVR